MESSLDAREMAAGVETEYDLPDLAKLARAIDRDDTSEAFARIRSVCVLPEMCASLCPGLSVSMPVAANPDDGTPVATLRDVYAGVARQAREKGLTRLTLPTAPTGNQVAIVGGGPAGISCAISLLEQGHEVTLYERGHQVGGVPQLLIRNSRYPGAQREIDAILQPGLQADRLHVMLGHTLGETLTLLTLRSEYDAVLVAAGLWEEHSLGCAKGVIGGLSFLADAKSGQRRSMPPRVVVLAGGDSAMDAAAVANELGASELTIIFDGKLADMHWHMPETWFNESGARCMDCTRVIAYNTDESDRLVSIKTADANSATEQLLPTDLVIESMGLGMDETIREACTTERDGVFTAGAVINGGASVGKCVAEGMQAATQIDQFLQKGKNTRTLSTSPADHEETSFILLESCPKLDCGRSTLPEETISRLESIIAERYPYRLVEESVAEHLHWTALFIDGMDFLSMGKGIDPIMSKAGALAECAEWMSSLETAAMAGFTIAHQDDLPARLDIADLVSHVEVAEDHVLESIKNSDAAHYWVDGFSLIDEKPLKVPIDFVRQINAPNGLASGNRIEEAIVHATNEIFERRALITVLRNRMVMPTMDPESIDNDIIQSQLAFIQDRGIEVTLKDLSFGGELPCVGAYFLDPNIPDTHQFRQFFKVGSSFNAEDALIRTFTEYTQGRRLDEFIDDDPKAQARVLEHDFRRLKSIPDDGDNFLSTFLFGFIPFRNAEFLREGECVPFPQNRGYEDCLEDIEACKSICKTLERDYIIVDCTDPDIGFPVAQVIIPGYSDILPYHPASSRVLFENWTRNGAIRSYDL
jgi:YcaO-like protein with predicted kinase domain